MQEDLTRDLTGGIDWRQPGKHKYRKNEVYLDVLESVNVLVSTKSMAVVHCAVDLFLRFCLLFPSMPLFPHQVCQYFTCSLDLFLPCCCLPLCQICSPFILLTVSSMLFVCCLLVLPLLAVCSLSMSLPPQTVSQFLSVLLTCFFGLECCFSSCQTLFYARTSLAKSS